MVLASFFLILVANSENWTTARKARLKVDPLKCK